MTDFFVKDLVQIKLLNSFEYAKVRTEWSVRQCDKFDHVIKPCGPHDVGSRKNHEVENRDNPRDLTSFHNFTQLEY